MNYLVDEFKLTATSPPSEKDTYFGSAEGPAKTFSLPY